jgi:hypothetical protein
MYRLIQICAGLALVGWAAIALSYSFDAFITPIPAFRYCSDPAFCITQQAAIYVLVGLFNMIFLVVALLSALILSLRVRHWALASALLAQAIVSFFGGANLTLWGGSLAYTMEATFNYDPAIHPSLGAMELIMFTSVPLVLFLLPRTLPRWPHLLPAITCLAVAGGALAFILPDNHYSLTTRYLVLTAVYVLGWGAATALLLVAWWIARRDAHQASQSAPTAHAAGESASG